MHLSIVIPFKNEASRLPESLRILDSYRTEQQTSSEIILVDDGSTDKTVDYLGKFLDNPSIRLVSHKENQGKGAALQTGVAHANGKYILCTDADLSTPITEIDKLQDYIYRGYDIVIGSRALPESCLEKKQSLLRRLLGKGGNILIRLILGLPYKDTQCGFKLYKRHVAQELFSRLTMKRFSCDYEILYLAGKNGYKVKEVGVRWRDSKPSSVRPFRDSFGALIDLIKIRFGS